MDAAPGVGRLFARGLATSAGMDAGMQFHKRMLGLLSYWVEWRLLEKVLCYW